MLPECALTVKSNASSVTRPNSGSARVASDVHLVVEIGIVYDNLVRVDSDDRA